MPKIAPVALSRYIFGGQIYAPGCLRMRGIGCPGSARRSLLPQRSCRSGHHHVHTSADAAAAPDATIPFRKQLKDEAKRRRAHGPKKNGSQQSLPEWELTVGIEIHAQLNTERKLFSRAASTINDEANTHVALFDVAMPGSQPIFQKETLIPAIRAALALNCDIQKTSRFDRKHYFHWDQPSGYQITQYYEPFAKDGYITLYPQDGIAEEDGKEIRIGIKQVQMEQDTAKTISQPGDIHLLDFNRVGLPLIEIITLPQIHHPRTAAALVRKVQMLLSAVDACVLGMESGGLRADVNVSVRRTYSDDENAHHEYGGMTRLGQRTEIKNLSSFKAVEDAIIAERDRQIAVLEAGGTIEGETRGWTIGSRETRRLRGKEGEVDYRYMPDPDLGPVIVGKDLVRHLASSLGILPDEEIEILVKEYGLTVKDAMSLISLNDGGRAEYFRDVVDDMLVLTSEPDQLRLGKLCCNWVLHEMGGLVSDAEKLDNALQMTRDGDCIIPHSKLATLIHHLDSGKITSKTAKRLFASLFANETKGISKEVNAMIDEAGAWYHPMSEGEYSELAQSIIDVKAVEDILAGQEGKFNFLLGKMMKKSGVDSSRIDPKQAAIVLRRVIEGFRK